MPFTYRSEALTRFGLPWREIYSSRGLRPNYIVFNTSLRMGAALPHPLSSVVIRLPGWRGFKGYVVMRIRILRTRRMFAKRAQQQSH